MTNGNDWYVSTPTLHHDAVVLPLKLSRRNSMLQLTTIEYINGVRKNKYDNTILSPERSKASKLYQRPNMLIRVELPVPVPREAPPWVPPPRFEFLLRFPPLST